MNDRDESDLGSSKTTFTDVLRSENLRVIEKGLCTPYFTWYDAVSRKCGSAAGLEMPKEA